MPIDLYVLLGVSRQASDGDIRRAYKRLARRFHPGINPGDREAAERFEHIVMAYETLVDPNRRQQYDAGDAPPPPAASRASGFEGFDFSPAAFAERSTTFGDLFAAAAPGRAARGADVHTTIAVSLDDLVAPSRHVASVTRLAACEPCGGLGVRQVGDRECPACDGRGDVRVVRGHMLFRTPCTHCAGTGRRAAERCRVCDGRGATARTDHVTFEVPAGTSDGAVVRCVGWGHAGTGGGAAGDLVATVTVRPHEVFRRDGDDLTLEVPVAVHEAGLGARIALPSIDGAPVRLRVPPGTQAGRRFRVRGRGLPSPKDGTRGDIVAEVRLVLPDVADERAKALLRELGGLQTSRVRDGRFPSDQDGA